MVEEVVRPLHQVREGKLYKTDSINTGQWPVASRMSASRHSVPVLGLQKPVHPLPRTFLPTTTPQQRSNVILSYRPAAPHKFSTPPGLDLPQILPLGPRVFNYQLPQCALSLPTTFSLLAYLLAHTCIHVTYEYIQVFIRTGKERIRYRRISTFIFLMNNSRFLYLFPTYFYYIVLN